MGDLEVNLQEFDVGQVVIFLNQAGKTGALRIEGDSKKGTIYVTAGKVVHSESGEIMGLEALYDLTLEDRGRAVFEKNVTAPKQTLEEDAGSLMQEFEKRRIEFKELKEKMPPLDSVLAKSASVGSESGVSIRRTDWQVLALIDHKRTLKEVITASKLGAYDAYKAIIWLREQNLIFDPKEFEHLIQKQLRPLEIYLDEFGKKGVGMERWHIALENWAAADEANKLLLESLSINDNGVRLKEVKLKSLDKDSINKLFNSLFKHLETEAVSIYGKILAKRKLDAVRQKIAAG